MSNLDKSPIMLIEDDTELAELLERKAIDHKQPILLVTSREDIAAVLGNPKKFIRDKNITPKGVITDINLDPGKRSFDKNRLQELEELNLPIVFYTGDISQSDLCLSEKMEQRSVMLKKMFDRDVLNSILSGDFDWNKEDLWDEYFRIMGEPTM